MIKLTKNDPIPENHTSIVVNGDDVFVYFDGDDNPFDTSADDVQNNAIQIRSEKRKIIKNTISIMTIETGLGSFDADEESQNRMMRAILTMDDVETINWTLADNTSMQVNKAELSEALRLAFKAQSNIWEIT